MVLPEMDWKNQPRHIVDWFIVVVALVLLSVYLYLWGTNAGPQFFGIGLFFAAWLGVFFTDYWQPILYPVVALTVAFITWALFLGGLWEQPIGQIAILLNVIFLFTSVYLFYYEER